MGSIRGLICFLVYIVVHACGYELSEHKNPISSTLILDIRGSKFMKIVIGNQKKEETVSSITYVVDLFNRLFNSGTSKYARRFCVFQSNLRFRSISKFL